MDVVVNLQFSLVETLWQAFWRTTPDELRGRSVQMGVITSHLFIVHQVTAICVLLGEAKGRYTVEGRLSDIFFYGCPCWIHH